MDLSLSTSQKILLSQKMLQSAEILQMSSIELLDYVKEISVENPVVDYEETHDESEDFNLLKRKLDYLDSSDEQNRIYYSEEKYDESENDGWKFKGRSGESLESCLLEQMNVTKCCLGIKKIGRYIIQSLDQNGYLNESAADIAKTLGVDEKYVASALNIVKGFEPAGAGAADLRECLLIQLKRKNIKNPLAEAIISDYLELLAKNQLHIISKKLKARREAVEAAAAVVKSLNPKPGNSFDSGKSLEYITPDAIIAEGKNGYEVILNDKFFPNIGINAYYRSMLGESGDSGTREYISKKIRQAQWIMTCIEKRNSTLIKTLNCIVSIQKDFFDSGFGHVKPMRLGDVAAMIDMHESTVSRAVKQKYIQCRHGLFPLGYFFQHGVQTGAFGKTSAEGIKAMIKEIIESEETDAPLSDREITGILNKKGIEISRRTVAKYRAAMGMRGTSGRRF